MKAAKTLLILCGLLCLDIRTTHADNVRTLRGVVITPDGTMVPEFTVTIRPIVDRPELIRRQHFKNGEFTLRGLDRERYQIIITAPSYVGVKLKVDFGAQASSTDYRIAILHHPRSGANLLTEEPGYAVSPKAMEQKVPDAAREAYEKGVHLHREGHLEEALVAYGQSLRFCPNYIQVLGDLGTIYLLYNRPDSALAYLRRALEIDSSNTAIRLNVAVAFMIRGDYGEASSHLEHVIRAEPDNSLPIYYMAKLQYLQGKYGSAEQNLRRSLEGNPGLLDGWLLLVDVALQQKDYITAGEALMQLREAMNNRMFSAFVDEQLSLLGNSRS